MDNTELSIRGALAYYFGSIFNDMYSKNPSLLATMEERIKIDQKKTLVEMIQKNELSEREAAKITSINNEFFSNWYSPERRIEHIVALWMKGENLHRTEFNLLSSLIEYAEEYGGDAVESVKEMMEAYTSLKDYYVKRDGIVSRLAAKAKEEGIFAVTTGEAIKSAVFQEFPTARDYLSVFEKKANAEKKIHDIVTPMFFPEKKGKGILALKRLNSALVERMADDYLNIIRETDVKALYQNE